MLFVDNLHLKDIHNLWTAHVDCPYAMRWGKVSKDNLYWKIKLITKYECQYLIQFIPKPEEKDIFMTITDEKGIAWVKREGSFLAIERKQLKFLTSCWTKSSSVYEV